MYMCHIPCGVHGFTHVDPFEDTERLDGRRRGRCWPAVSPTSIRSRILKGVTRQTVSQWRNHVSPTSIRSRILKVRPAVPVPIGTVRFTHVDPFEDTESLACAFVSRLGLRVSPTSIRSRILKDPWTPIPRPREFSFTHVDPFEDTESSTCPGCGSRYPGFTHVDPFEDTERLWRACDTSPADTVSPTSIRSRILKGSVHT